MRIAFSVLPVLFAIACSSILVPAASTTKGGGLFHADAPPFNGGGGGGGGGTDSGTSTWPTDDTGTTTWTTGTDSGTSTSTQDCPFGDSAEFEATYIVNDDGCGWGTESFPSTASLVCNGGDFELTDSGFFGTTVSCAGNGVNFTCQYGDGSYSITIEGQFTKGGSQASGTWYLSSDNCSGGGDFTWN